MEMEMAKATRKHETKSANIEVELSRKVVDASHYWDGYEIDDGRKISETYEIKITSKANGKVYWSDDGEMTVIDHDNGYYRNAPAGAHAKVCGVYINEEVYNAIVQMMEELDAELPKTDEYLALEAEEKRKKAETERLAEENLNWMAAEHKERTSHPGWCEKCGSYCYGDCEA